VSNVCLEKPDGPIRSGPVIRADVKVNGTPLSDCGNGTRSRRERSPSLKSAVLMDEQVADSCSSNVTVLAIPAQFISRAWCDVSMRIREQLRGSMRRENAADQYAADGTIKINVLRECFRHKGAQMAKSESA
jgi:hypothetical protein